MSFQIPGVPALLDPLAVPDFVGTLLTGDLLTYSALGYGPQWGIFLDGAPVITADNVVSVDYKAEWTISDFPVEEGAFQSFDKVYQPWVAKVRFSSGGSLANRQALLDSIAAIAGDLNLYDVVTPEEVYSSCNVTHYDFRRTASQGVGLIQVDVWLTQVMVIDASPDFQSTQQPSGADPVIGGTVQTVTLTSAQMALLSGLA